MKPKICASILSANFLQLGDELKRAEEAGCDYIHVDVMDGNFVKNMAVGLCVAKWLSKGCNLRLDAHLAVESPQDFVELFAEANMDSIIFHPETYAHHYALIQKIRENKMLAGVALSPSTTIESIRYILPELDIIDQLAVNAGFPNQKYLEIINGKLTELVRLREEHGYHYEIQVDGGVDEHTAPMAVEAGADVLISGSSLFESKDMAGLVRKLKDSRIKDTAQ